MAAFDLEEQERVDALKDWWKQNRLSVGVAIAVLIVAVASVLGWRQYKAGRSEQAAGAFTKFGKTAEGRDAKKTREAAIKIMEQFPESLYAAQAGLVAAQQSFEGNDLEVAQATLRWVIEKSKSSQLQSIARLRLAAVFFDQKKYDEALKLLDGNKDTAFLTRTADLKGDILAAQGKLAEARASYKAVIEKASVNSPDRQLAQIKLDALGEGK